ncbi:hypothetical protein [Actinoplanes sp. TFC3]|uniref:hypothetical protein n=1 Tax=Actinoplanes sp. TFC3 TaxID=1710355 RepID=UPI000835C97D|nr:hypothetical protein [Actinoplanes sp. TFC3]
MRSIVEPDPAWDASTDENGVLTVELSWPPDALAGRQEELVISPGLAQALTGAGLTGFTTAAAAGVYLDQTFGVEPGDVPPPLLRLVPGDDALADLAYVPGKGFSVSEKALQVLQAHCKSLMVGPHSQ